MNVIVLLYHVIEEEHDTLNYVYHNLLHLKADNYIYQLLDNLNLNLLSIRYNKILSYNDEIFNKFMYVIVMAVRKNIDNMNILVNKYMPYVIEKGNKYIKMYASILCLYIVNNFDVTMDYEYHDGLIVCLQTSSRWNDVVHFFYNKTMIYSCHIYDIFIQVIRLLYPKRNEKCQLINGLFALCKKKDMSAFSLFISLYYEKDEQTRYICDHI